MKKNYDVAAYIWPAYTGEEPRARMFWPEGMGEWQTVRSAQAKFEGHQWPRKPLWGYQNEADPYVMEMQIEAATDHGVNVFLYDWYWFDHRPFLEQCLNNGFLKAKNRSKMKFYLMWANHNANYTWDKRLAGDFTDIWLGQVDRPEFEQIAVRLLQNYFTLENYYKIDGCPVFMIYDIGNFINGFGGVDQAREALEWFRQEAVRTGFPGLHLQMTIWSQEVMNLSGVDQKECRLYPHEITEKLGIDSVTHYQFVHFVNVDRDYGQVAREVQLEWKKIEQTYSIPYFPHVSLGWDNNPRFQEFRPGIIKNNTPEEIEKMLRAAKEYVDTHPNQPPLITINSWNEWTESSYLQPDNLYGYGYLNAVKKVFQE